MGVGLQADAFEIRSPMPMQRKRARTKAKKNLRSLRRSLRRKKRRRKKKKRSWLIPRRRLKRVSWLFPRYNLKGDLAIPGQALRNFQNGLLQGGAAGDSFHPWITMDVNEMLTACRMQAFQAVCSRQAPLR
jgi:hypothetical protein